MGGDVLATPPPAELEGLAPIAVIVPAYEEERLLPRMLARVPSWVAQLHVVDDGSRDRTAAVVAELADPRVRLHRHPQNRGVGAAIVTGYAAALAAGARTLVVMAADDQMDPADLTALLTPLMAGASYVKGNRFRHAEWRRMPLARRVAGKALAWLTRAAGGPRIDDSQCGYTALSAEAAARLPLNDLWPRYGYPNDLLLLCAQHGLPVAEVPVRPVYADERSGVRPYHAAQIGFVLLRRRLRSRGRWRPGRE